jgi:hypothetical protein
MLDAPSASQTAVAQQAAYAFENDPQASMFIRELLFAVAFEECRMIAAMSRYRFQFPNPSPTVTLPAGNTVSFPAIRRRPDWGKFLETSNGVTLKLTAMTREQLFAVADRRDANSRTEALYGRLARVLTSRMQDDQVTVGQVWTPDEVFAEYDRISDDLGLV